MKKLRTKFLVNVLLPVVGIMMLTGIVSYYIARNMLIAEMSRRSSISLQQAVDQFEIGAWRGLQTLLNLAALERSLDVGPADLQRLFMEMKPGLPTETIFAAFPDGRFVSSLPAGYVPGNYDPRKELWYQRAEKSAEPIVIALRRSTLTVQRVVTVALRVTSAGGSLRCVIGYETPLTTIREKLSHIRLYEDYEGASLFVFTRDGKFILGSDSPEDDGGPVQSRIGLYKQIMAAIAEGNKSYFVVGESNGVLSYGGFQESSLKGIYLGFSVPLQEALVPIFALWGAQILLGLIAAAVLSIILVKMADRIVGPIKMLAEASARLSQGDYEQNLPPAGDDEVGKLVESFNTMAEGLRQRDFIRNTFGRYLAREVVDQLLESEDGLSLGGETREVSLLMSDLRGFTAHTAGMPPERILKLLNRYLGGMVEILLDQRGTIDEIVGDGILAVFGAPTHMDDHVERAVACALRMQAAMDSINRMNEADGLPRLEMGIGINTGRVVVGNIGSERRTKYGVVGSEVNFTGRIESYTLGGQILISRSSYDRVRDLVEIRDIVHVEMKGLHGTVTLYDVRGISGTYSVKLPETLEAPSPIVKKIPVRIGNLHGKIVTHKSGNAWITHLSEQSAVIVLPERLDLREEIKIELLDEETGETVGEVFAKVISTDAKEDHTETVIRFTFVSPEIRRFLRSGPAGPTEHGGERS
jgi:class 3 adenylate cyclase